MATDDIRLSDWNLRASAGTTVSLRFVAPDALTSLSVWTGGTTGDVDDLTDATEHAGVLSTTTVADDTATVALTVPEGGSTALRLEVDGVVQTVGRLIPSTTGTSSADATITLTSGATSYTLTVLGAGFAPTTLDGGTFA